MYKCVCGKEYETAKSYGVHKRHCKLYDEKVRQPNKVLQDNNMYETKVCIVCGTHYKRIEQEWSTDRFCSKSCRQKRASNSRTPEIFKKATEKRLANSEAMERNAEHLRNLWKTRHDDIVEACNKTKRTPEFREHARKKSKEFWDSLSKEEKMIRVKNSFLKKDAGKCYEDVWEDIFKENNIPYEREVKFYKHHYLEMDKTKSGYNLEGYRVDFLINNRIDFEVDGISHNKVHDDTRDDFFQNKVGLKVYRVKATLDKKQLEEETTKFLIFYKENI